MMGLLKIAKYMKKNAKESDVYKTRYRGGYHNINAVPNLIRYVTRTRPSEDRAHDLMCSGCIGAFFYNSIEDVINSFISVQLNMRGGKDIGVAMFHEIYVFDSQQEAFFAAHPEVLPQFAYDCAWLYYLAGHQVVYAVHNEPDDPDKRMHLHFAVNAVNFYKGNKWHTNINEQQREREYYMNLCFLHYTGWAVYICNL